MKLYNMTGGGVKNKNKNSSSYYYYYYISFILHHVKAYQIGIA